MKATAQTLKQGLSTYVTHCWSQARAAKEPIEAQMMRSLRQRAGKYDPDKIGAIRRVGGSLIYMLLSGARCRDAEAWLKDILVQPDHIPWDLEPTPMPELPAKEGTPQLTGAQLKDKAHAAAELMKEKINDQFSEGGWYTAIEEFLHDVVTYKAGFIKGPVLRIEKVRRRIFDGTTWTNVIDNRLVPEYERRSPFYIYPSPSSSGIDDGYLIDRLTLTTSQMSALAGVPGFDYEAIMAVLHDHREGILQKKTSSSGGDGLTQTGHNPFTGGKDDKIEVLEFWGDIDGGQILSWANEPDTPLIEDFFGTPTIDPAVVYHVCVWLCGDRVLKVMPNPDPMGLKPFSKVSFEEIPGVFWGTGLCEMIEDVQTACNAIARAIINNVAIASGPQLERNVDKVIPGESKEMWPWKVWDVTDAQMSGAQALRFYSPPMVVDKLMAVYEFFLKRAEEQTGIPTYTGGSMKDVAANGTASGFSMLISQAARGIKNVVRNIDSKVIATSVERQYYFNLDHDKGIDDVPDLKIIAKGTSSLIAKEQQAIRRSEFLRATNNPVDMEIIGKDGRRQMLREAARALELDVNKVIPEQTSPEIHNSANVEAQPVQSVNPAGDTAAGSDFKLF
ncbi:portal protein [Candidatus Magnetominusculus xianensis]|uniref:Uncharacterized protein n=1 Tax=Candidatus Magnetominusculus xianensis TaxID=1748249 RepID=A0ABR5SFV2_9BACT|nr:hypothetical protein [Candidatus Magnetominusculus xianensis]KWT86921.1 hypothetical protein ASN18_1393 [Candidatus Magnetominusculus xianensis]MBF0403954.1 hypothetical protein [Nitrospirota bacterium]